MFLPESVSRGREYRIEQLVTAEGQSHSSRETREGRRREQVLERPNIIETKQSVGFLGSVKASRPEICFPERVISAYELCVANLEIPVSTAVQFAHVQLALGRECRAGVRGGMECKPTLFLEVAG